MATEIRVPTLGESVTEATVAQWFKKPGESVAADEPLVELETDKVTVEVPAPAAGVLSEIIAKDGETVEVGALLGQIGEGKGEAPAPKKEEPKKAEAKPESKREEPKKEEAKGPAKPADAEPSPAVRRVAAENDLDVSKVEGTGKGGRVTKADAEEAASSAKSEPQAKPAAEAKAPAPADQAAREERVKMTRLRKTIATRLKEAQNTAAMLTTFNEVDMTNVMALRSQYKDLFEKKHGVRVGFMGFFVKACVHALHELPAVNAEIDGEELVYKNYYNIGVAVGTDRGLVVPVIRDAQDLSIADIEKTINDFGRRARDGALKLEELQGGTFTISNGGVYGSLMSTPILNAPQSGILGMHKIQERPMVIDGKIEIRPMMYLALSYDHRIVDGKEAVTFLVRVKESLEDPQRLLLDL
ncbi:2-oxoglutarate dehydrogenase complex dihydrolipoyllysine-residue succinyltransferase [Parvibaculum sp.]|jgi:2-oxoglutarate dehydrogenase E2 component (dihydrolipoamide succinyltransferase)|uniref:2-oxoglutarate dehydrogenase complex dihydrolipoyllysine-residue succinyltransferase n=1 Tax=Parvibaculum sp. TaxID=2024848 RepID=UPI001B066A03|nr:2-oxoglutarate dehydrogenase complex dihydrolipoyllysine-residue succinyltransferase [Parvibaculum sp.]MBO6668587.1 2-oxoglutarate dehydrogenase complex dihydrolipoyllysine-residue succinyltransferase [Parvibaculum sp.]MBO6691093.1 2-oxoglutarate dehydrogenase complex dihydrolipoyllysine-residue succinyltransferase [Parvibaculum sp.]MBO6714263.1 2-oxoglutarate dehydrogenase complex dihydrolipoyllysine-residue succinyltransferase [Parvibaculum sp.]|tara:strand:- start:2443 stop:3684 length:1242 start_codon:yes stop_codon:yes gene_type:complete